MGASVVACCHAPPVFQAAERVLDAVTLSVEGAVEGDLDFAVQHRWDAGLDPTLNQRDGLDIKSIGRQDTLVQYLGSSFPAVGEAFVAAGGTLDNFSVQVDGTGSPVTFTISAVDASTQPTTTLYSTQFDVRSGFLPVTTLSNINLNLSIGTTYFATLSAGPNALIRVGVTDVFPGLATTDPYPAGEFATRYYNQGGSSGQFKYFSSLDLAFNATFDVPEPAGLSLLAVPFCLLLISRRQV